MSELKTAAFFDLDNTIIIGTNSLFLYVKYLVKNKIMSKVDLLKGIFLSALHKLNLINVEKLLDQFVSSYKGKTEEDVLKVTNDWFETEVVPRLAKEAYDKLKEHQKKGHVTVLLSAASQYVCLPVKDHMGFEHSIHTIVEVIQGALTGKFLKPLCYHQGKVHYSREFANKHHIDLKKSFFYTDSISDLPMLEEVGHPYVINPDPLLKRLAKKRKWPIEKWKTV